MSDRGIDALSRIAPLNRRDVLTGQALDTLTGAEKAAISKRLLTSLVGAAVFGLGLSIELLVPSHALVGHILQAVAAAIVAAHTFGRALQGFFSSPPTELTEQLVALAILSAMVVGDFATAALVPLLLEIGHLLEERSALGAQAAIRGLKQLCARQATVLRDGNEAQVAPHDVTIDDTVIVRPGDVIPVDGHVLSGFSYVDQSSVTGESKPEEIAPGDQVFAGSTAIDGQLTLRATRVGEDTTIGRVVHVLKEVEQAKTPIIRVLERLAGLYLPAVLILACLVLFVSGDFDRFITVLIVACPCALVLAAPSAMVAAMSRATRASILIKDAGFLERAAKVDTLILDKTGTVTQGTLSAGTVHAMAAFNEADVIGTALVASQGSRHPASRAIALRAREMGLLAPGTTQIREIPGQGVKAVLDTHTIRVGRLTWLVEEGVAVPEHVFGGGVGVAKEHTLVGHITLEDRAKSDADTVIAAMRDRGFDRIVLLSGDKAEVAESVGRALGLDRVVSEVLPDQKLTVVLDEQKAGRSVLMLGDGINDALALSAADVGVAIGSEMNDVVLGGADVALHTEALDRLPFLIDLADQTHRTIITNVLVGMGFSVGMLAVASSGLIPPLLGALLHNGGAIFVVLNSARLLRFSENGPSAGSQVDEPVTGQKAVPPNALGAPSPHQ